MAYKPYADLTPEQQQIFGSEEQYKTTMEATQVANTPQTTLTDPSQYVQAQVGAAVTQPTLPQGTSVLPNLALQQVTPTTLQTTPGLQGQVQATTPTTTVAPTIPTTEAPSATQIQQAQVTICPSISSSHQLVLYLKW
jgi:hypothetical protein